MVRCMLLGGLGPWEGDWRDESERRVRGDYVPREYVS